MEDFPTIDGVQLIGQQVDVPGIMSLLIACVIFAGFIRLMAYMQKEDDGLIWSLSYAASIIACAIFSLAFLFMLAEAITPIYVIEISDTTDFKDVYDAFDILGKIGESGYTARVR